jgi:hypothetical protein
MNCQTFSELASDIARDQMMNAATRSQGLVHASACDSCAARLSAQQDLTSNLRELASATKDQIASAVVWDRLSIAFDASTVTQITTNRPRKIYSAGAIAAMLMLAFGLMQLVRHRQSTDVEATIAANFTTAMPAQLPNQGRETDAILPAKRKPQVLRRPSPASRALTLPVNQPKEIATDFILLTYDGELGSDAQIVRVELPRSAMANFGLPVNIDRADQRVKADVIVGADGLARAIRFVQ